MARLGSILCPALLVLGGCFSDLQAEDDGLSGADTTTSGDSSAEDSGDPATSAGPSTSGQDSTSTSTNTTAASTSGKDTEGDTDTDTDTDDPDPIDPLAPWGPAISVDALNTTDNDDDPSLPSDMLEIYFASTRGGFEDIYVARRDSVDAEWGEAAVIASLESLPPSRGNPAVSTSGNTLFFTVTVDGVINLYTATRDSRRAQFADATAIDELNTSADEFAAAPSGDLLSLVFARNSGDDANLFLATRPSTAAAWSNQGPIDAVNSPSEDATAWTNPEATVLMFASERPTRGPKDLYISTRLDSVDVWTAPVPVESLNTMANEEDPWFSPDGRTVFFARSVDGQGLQLFTATR